MTNAIANREFWAEAIRRPDLLTQLTKGDTPRPLVTWTKGAQAEGLRPQPWA